MTQRQYGNIIHADFRKPLQSLEIGFKVEILYQDEQVLLTRVTTISGGKSSRADHFLFAAPHD